MTASPESIAGPLVLLGGTGLQPGSAPLWEEIATLLPDGSGRFAILALATAQRATAAGQRARLMEVMLNGMGFTVRSILASVSQQADEPDSFALLQEATGIIVQVDEPHTLLMLSSNRLQTAAWETILVRHRGGALLVASAGAAAALGEWAFAPLKPHPPMVAALAFERLPGMGWLPGTGILPYFNRFPSLLLDKLSALFSPEMRLVGIDEEAALVSGKKGWRVAGLGSATILIHNEVACVPTAGTMIPVQLLPSYSAR